MRSIQFLTAAAMALGAGVAFTAIDLRAAPAAPPPTWARCAVCHNAEKGGADKLGPNLWGIYGSKAGLGKFAFSPALKGSSVKWTDANLDKWMTKPAALIPGNRMVFPGIADPAKRAEVIAWLKTRK